MNARVAVSIRIEPDLKEWLDEKPAIAAKRAGMSEVSREALHVYRKLYSAAEASLERLLSLDETYCLIDAINGSFMRGEDVLIAPQSLADAIADGCARHGLDVKYADVNTEALRLKLSNLTPMQAWVLMDLIHLWRDREDDGDMGDYTARLFRCRKGAK